MAVEPKRGCGYRKVGGLYLVGEGLNLTCDKLPYELTLCPVCNQGIKFSRGFTWLSAQFFKPHLDCKDALAGACPICTPQNERYGLMWVGEKYYTPPPPLS